MLPMKRANFKLPSAKLGAECNVDTNNSVLLNSLPRDDFSAPLHLRLDKRRDIKHLSFDFVLMGPLEVDTSIIFVERRFEMGFFVTWNVLCVDAPTIVKTNTAVELGTANGTKGII